MAETPQYDVVIIGSGPGGYVAAIRACQWGLKTLVIEREPVLGGTCLNWGCIPTKALLYSAELYDHMKNAPEFGIECKGVSLDWPAMRARKDKVVKKHNKGVEYLFRKNKVESMPGVGRLKAPGPPWRVTVEKDGKTTEVQGRNILIATGSEARALPGVDFDGDTILSNKEILSLSSIPKSLIVVGAGAVGVEFASIFHSFDTEVTLLEMLPRVVPVEDEEISAELEKAFKKRGIKVVTNALVEGVKKTAKGVTVTYQSKGQKESAPSTLNAEKILIGIGRKPNTEGIGLEKTRIKVERGCIHVGPYMETDEAGIYAIGDLVAGLPQLAHAASMEGIVAVGKMAGRDVVPVNKNHIPGCTYCEPQIGSVGLTERAAREAGYKIKVNKFPFTANSKATILGQHEGFIKVVAEEKYGELLGVHVIGPLATEMIAEAVVALQLEATVDDLMFTIHAHPTLWEGMADAVAGVKGLAINI